jgi:hypothetical protein
MHVTAELELKITILKKKQQMLLGCHSIVK